MTSRASLFLISILAAGAGACGNRLLVGNDPDGGAPPAQTGAAGTSSLPTTGASGTGGLTGVAGTGGLTGVAGTGGLTGVAGTGGLTGVAGTGGLTGVAGTGFPTTGVAGTGGLSTGFAGAPGEPSTGGAGTGAATATRVVTPLRISGQDAVTRVANVLWRDMPSADLLSQASLGHFKTTDDLYGAIRQMLADPRARAGIGAFFRSWLRLDELDGGPGSSKVAKDPKVFPEFTDELAHAMATETTTFGVNMTLSGGTFMSLMTANHSYLNGPLGQLYGVTVTGVTGDDFKKVDLDPGQRAGLLTQPALQALASFADRNSPSRRGEYTLNVFECMQIPLPPANIEGLGQVTGKTVRQALAESLNQNAACAACHALIDPPGLVFETFDALGRWRTKDNGFPIDMSNINVMNLTEDNGPVPISDAVQLAKYMGASRRVQDCYARTWLAFVMGGAVIDERLVQNVAELFRGSGLDLKELIATVLLSEPFLAPP